MSIIHRKNSSQHLLLIFNGWGMDERAFPNHPDMDMLIISEWHTKPALPIIEIQKYTTVTLVAWSLGVWQAANCDLLSQLKLYKTIAINGTPNPIHNQYGIPVATFQGTLQHLSETTRDKFQKRMMGGIRNYNSMANCLPLRNIENQRNELQYFWDNAQKGNDSKFAWTTAFIGSNDMIFPTENQYNYWNKKANIKTIDIPHYPFISPTDWATILD